MFRRHTRTRYPSTGRPTQLNKFRARYEALEDRRLLALTAIESGLDSFVAQLQGELDTNVFNSVFPLLGDALSTQGQVIADLGSSLDASPATNTIADVKMALHDALGTYSVNSNGIVSGIGGINAINGVGNPAVDADAEINFLFQLQGSATFSAPFDIGLAALGFTLAANVNVTVGYSFDVAFGTDATGVYFATNASGSPELTFQVNVSVPNGTFNGAFGFLDVMVTDLGSMFQGTFTVDLLDDDADGKLRPNETVGLDSTFTGTAEVDLHFDASFGAAEISPRILADFSLDQEFNASDPSPRVAFTDVNLDLGRLFSSFVDPVLDQVRDVTHPLEGIARALTDNIQPFEEFGVHISLLDIMEVYATAQGRGSEFATIRAFVEAVNQVRVLDQAADTAANNLGSVLIPLGAFDFGNVDLRTVSDLTGFTPHITATPPVNPLARVRSELADALSPGDADFFDENDEIDGGGATFPILDPASAFQLFLGKQDVDLFLFDFPEANGSLDASYVYTFVIPPGIPISVEFFGALGFAANLKVGYDTQGIFAAAAPGGSPSDVFNGFFVDERGNSDPELVLTVTLGVRGGPGVPDVLFAGAEGALEGTVNFELQGSHKVRYDEIRQNLAMGADCVFDIDGKVEVVLSLFAEVNSGFGDIEVPEVIEQPVEQLCGLFDPDCDVPEEIPTSIRYKEEIARQPIPGLDFSYGCDTTSPANSPTFDPGLARLLGSVLYLNIGDDAPVYRNVFKDVEAEMYQVAHVSGDASGETVVVRAFGYEQTFSGVTEIAGFAGTGVDDIDLTDTVVPSMLDGGDEGDRLTAGIGAATFFGRAGNDTLTGGSADDELHGGSETDRLLGRDGSDSLYGDEGDDRLFGDDKTSALSGTDSLFGGPGSDYLRGGPQRDTLDGGEDSDVLFGDAGSDIIRGGGDLDVIFGGEGDDNLFGEGGDDFFFWSEGDGSDVVEGGAGSDYVIAESGGFEDIFDLHRAGVRVHLVHQRAVTSTLDADDVENILLGSHAGRDTITLGDLFGTDVRVIGVSSGDDDDTIDVGVGNLNNVVAAVFLDAGAGVDDGAFVNDSSTSLLVNYTVTVDSVTSANSPSAPGTQPARTFGGLTYTNALELLRVYGTQGSNAFHIHSTSMDTPVIIDGNAGDDTFNVGSAGNSLDGIQGLLTINGNAPTASDVLNIDDQGDTDPHTYTVTSMTVDRDGAATITYDTVEKLVVNAGKASDTVDIVDTLATTPVFANGNEGTDSFNLATGNLDALAGLVTITGGPDAGDRVLLHDAAHAAVVNYAVDRNSVTSKAVRSETEECEDRTFKGVNFDGTVEQVTLEGTQAKNEFVVAPSVDTLFTIHGNDPPAGDPDNRDYLEIVFLDTVNRKLTFSDRANGDGQWTFGNRQPVAFTGIEKFNYFPIVVSGADAGGGPHVRVFDADSLSLSTEFFAYSPLFTGGVRVATGDINNDGIPDIVTAAGPTGGPHIRAFDAASGVQLANYGRLGSFFAYELAGYSPVGIQLATGDFDGDGWSDLVVGGYTTVDGNESGSSHALPAPHVRVFSGRDGHEMTNFATKGINVAVGDVNGDQKLDIVVATDGTGRPPVVQVFNGLTGETFPVIDGGSFFAYDPLFRGGVYVATGDVNGDGLADIITGAGPGGGPHVRVFSGLDRSILKDFFAYAPSFIGGVRVAAADLDGDGLADIVTGAGPSGGPHLRVFSGLDLSDLGQRFAYSPLFTGGIFVAAHPETSSATQCPPALAAAEGAVGAGGGIAALNAAQLDQIRLAAVNLWDAAGLSVADAARLSQIEFRLSNLPADQLLRARGDLFLVDRFAAGHGWFVDPTPLVNEEFTAGLEALPGSDADDHYDLATAVVRALGEAMGLDHVAGAIGIASLMGDELPLGIRHVPAPADVAAVFAEGEF